MTLDEYLTQQNETRKAAGEPKVTDADFGAKVGLSQSHVSRLRNGVVRPSWRTMDAILKETGGAVTASAEDWPLRESVA